MPRGAPTANRPGAIRVGTVGTAVRGVELKLAEDGELGLVAVATAGPFVIQYPHTPRSGQARYRRRACEELQGVLWGSAGTVRGRVRAEHRWDE